METVENSQEDVIGSFLDELEGNFTADNDVVVDPVEVAVVDPIDPVVANADPAAIVAPVVAAVVDEEETVEQVNDRLRLQVMELTTRLSNPTQQIFPAVAPVPGAPLATVDGAPVVVAQPVGAKPIVPTQMYLTEEELDQVIDNPALIVTAIQRAQADIVSQMSGNLPGLISEMVATQVNQQILAQKAVTEFYTSNEDLRPYAQFAQFVMSEMESKHKDKTYAEIFELTASESRKRLGLRNPSAVTSSRDQNGKEVKPAFAGSKRTGTNRPAGKAEWFDPAAADMF